MLGLLGLLSIDKYLQCRPSEHKMFSIVQLWIIKLWHIILLPHIRTNNFKFDFILSKLIQVMRLFIKNHDDFANLPIDEVICIYSIALCPALPNLQWSSQSSSHPTRWVSRPPGWWCVCISWLMTVTAVMSYYITPHDRAHDSGWHSYDIMSPHRAY